jgi:proline iminopeptidase
MKARIRGTEIYFDVEGAGMALGEGSTWREKPVAFVVHGGPGSDHTGFRQPLAPLAAALQLVYFDHRGSGRSARGDASKYTLDENVQDMEALREHLGLGPIVSIGTSYGGMVAMAHAARYPGAVSHLVLVVTAAHRGFIARSREIVAQRGTPEQKALCEDLYAGRIDTPAKLLDYHHRMGSLYARKYDPAVSLDRLSRGVHAPEPLNAAFAPGGFMHAFDLRPELGAIRAPTLVIAGRHDWICAPEFSEEIHRLVPGSTLRIFEDSSHSIRVDEPERLRREVLEFVGGRAVSPREG